MWSGKSIGEQTFRQNDFNALTTYVLCISFCMHWIPAVPHYFKIWYDDREYEQQDLQSS